MKSGIYLVATPIGNIGDITLRGIDVLKKAEIIACEDTRVSRKLFSLLGISTLDKTFIAMHDHNERDISSELIAFATKGNIVAYISDAGSPLISDPGYKLARKCKDNNVFFTTIPGACAAICGLQLSGLPTDKFMFAGFIPNKDKARKETILKYKELDATIVFYETSKRLIKTLETIAEILDNREIAVAREISKMYEECKNGSAQDLIKYYTDNPPKGEIVLMIASTTEKEEINYIEELRQELSQSSLKTAVKYIVEKHKLNKNDVYQTALEIKNGQ